MIYILRVMVDLIQEEINQSDKLMDELAALILSDSNN